MTDNSNTTLPSFKLPLKRVQKSIVPPDQDDEPLQDVITIDNLSSSIANLRNAYTRNMELRVKYTDQPEKFMESEEQLFGAIKSFESISTDYQLIHKLDKTFFDTFALILDHENEDILGVIIEVISDVLDTEGTNPTECNILEEFSQNLVKDNGFLHVLSTKVDHLEKDEYRHQIISILESLVELLENIKPLEEWIPWLIFCFFERGTCESKYYAAELVAQLLLNPVMLPIFVEADGVEATLTVAAGYVYTDPLGSQELEYSQNIFDVLCSIHDSQEACQIFIEMKGMQTMLEAIKECKVGRILAIKVLYFLLINEKMVSELLEANGLGVLGALLDYRDKVEGKEDNLAKAYPHIYNPVDDERYLAGILGALCLHVSDTTQTTRLHNKLANKQSSIQKMFEKYCKITEKEKEQEKESTFQDADTMTVLNQLAIVCLFIDKQDQQAHRIVQSYADTMEDKSILQKLFN